jgi:predicted nucleic acid-binding protein
VTGFVVDASVAVKWLIAEPLSENAARLLDDDFSLAAPDLIYVESANALWAAERRGDMSDTGVREALEILADVRLAVLTSMKRLTPAALRLARDLDHPVYDCVYLALALQEQRPVITADRRFLNAVRSHSYLSDHVVALESLS